MSRDGRPLRRWRGRFVVDLLGPSAYEILVGEGSTPPNQQKPRGGP
jgi:hypothetical protein